MGVDEGHAGEIATTKPRPRPPYFHAMPHPPLDTHLLQAFVKLGLEEDLGPGDYTSQATIPAGKRGRAKLLVKGHGVLCGTPVARAVFNYLDPSCAFDVHIDEGADVSPGDVAFHVEGPIRTLLSGERLALNTLQRLSGIAHLSRVFAKAVAGTKAKILDTRKTTPGIRFLEKYAVKVGGAENYRVGLYDWIMIKDNHVDGAGGVRPAIEGVHRFQKEKGLDLDITVEVRNLKELATVLEVGGIRRVMLDNFELSELREAVGIIGDRVEAEASGGVTLDTVRAIAETGVDYISSGALTHSARQVDISFKIVK